MIDKFVVDKMISMMLGIFINGIGISLLFVDYVMVGKIGIIEVVFNLEYISD